MNWTEFLIITVTIFSFFPQHILYFFLGRYFNKVRSVRIRHGMHDLKNLALKE